LSEEFSVHCRFSPLVRARQISRVCCLYLQALMVYFQWFQIIKELPISWMPPQFSLRWDRVSHVFGAVTGRAASLDCLFQAWNLWQDETMQDIATSIFRRALFRYAPDGLGPSCNAPTPGLNGYRN